MIPHSERVDLVDAEESGLNYKAYADKTLGGAHGGRARRCLRFYFKETNFSGS